MKNLESNIQVYESETIKSLILVENEMEKTQKIIELNAENQMDENCDEIQIMETELADCLQVMKLAKLTSMRLYIEVSIIQQFLKIFRHRRENMSLKYISKQLNISMDELILWFQSESLTITKKKHGLYVNCLDFMDLCRDTQRRIWLIE